ncbi:MAG: hypothetical protein F6K00_02765 [Leptolyngbya sp. SIOISBB]|nr:hypothetical protein [Leptolyngbya sp. SIOISBB]
MSNTIHLSTDKTRFELAWRSLATNRWLLLTFLTLGTASNVMYAHTPLVAFAVMSGLVLTRRRAIAVALLLWVVNQAIGFGLRGYPLTATAFTWGALMGLGTLLVVTFAGWRPGFAQTTWVGHGLWLALSLLIGFGLYQGLILLAHPFMADGHWMDWAIVVKLFGKQTMWTGVMALAHGFLLWRQSTLVSQSQTQP